MQKLRPAQIRGLKRHTRKNRGPTNKFPCRFLGQSMDHALSLVVSLATPSLDAASRGAVRGASAQLHGEGLCLCSSDAEALLVARVLGASLSFDDATLLRHVKDLAALESFIFRACEAIWDAKKPRVSSVAASLDLLSTLAASLELLPALSREKSLHVLSRRLLFSWKAYGDPPRRAPVPQVSPECFVAFAALASMERDRGGARPPLTVACFDVLEWVQPRVPEEWWRWLSHDFFCKVVAVPHEGDHGSFCQLLAAVPPAAWFAIVNLVGFKLCATHTFGRADPAFMASWIVKLIKVYSASAAAAGLGRPHTDSWREAGYILDELMFNVRLKRCTDPEAYLHRSEAMSQVLVALYPEHSSKIIELLFGWKVGSFQDVLAECFLRHLRLTHCPTVREWTSVWKELLTTGACRNAVPVLAKWCPPDIWFDDAHLCRYVYSLNENWLCVYCTLYLFGPKSLRAAEAMAERPALRTIIRWLAGIAKKARAAPSSNGNGCRSFRTSPSLPPVDDCPALSV